MLSINNITSGYDKKQVLFEVSLEVNAGDVLLLTGGNGSGKSTLLKCIYNLLPLWSGCINFENQELRNRCPSDLIQFGIVYIPQQNFCFENLTVIENLQVSGNRIPKQLMKGRLSEVLEITGLEKFQKRKPFNLSGGERKSLAFAMALIHRPKLLLFDEPFAGIDAKNTTTLLGIFKETIIKPNNGVIIVEHQEDAKKLYNKKCIMELGKIKT